jgi:hypothetical protein
MTALLSMCAVLLLLRGGYEGVATDIGQAHVCFGLYIAIDVLKRMTYRRTVERRGRL